MSVNESHEQIYLVLYINSIQPSSAKHPLKTENLFHIITLFHFALS